MTTSEGVIRPQIEDRSPEEIRAIGESYRVVMTGTANTTPGDLLVFIVYNGILALASFVLLLISTTLFGITSNGILTGWTLSVWFLILGATYPLWFVSVPKLTALLTTDNLTQELHPYGTGWHIKKLWKTYDQTEDYIDMTADFIEGKQQFLTSDGLEVEFDWTEEFAPYLPMVPLYVRMENKVLENGLDSVIESMVSHNMLGKTLDEIRQPAVIDEMRQNITRALAGESIADAQVFDAQGNSIEERFGIKAELPTISPPRPTKDVREMLTGRVKAKQFTEVAQEMARPDPEKSWPGLSPDRAMRNVMIMNNEPGVTDESFTIDLTDRAKDAAGDAAAILGTLGPALAGHRGRNKPQTPGGKK